jgi:hypothetical protein
MNMASEALREIGVDVKENRLKKVINGCSALTPIVSALIRGGMVDKSFELEKLLHQVKQLQSLILKKVIKHKYKLTTPNYVAINRISSKICCDFYESGTVLDFETIADWVVILFEVDDIYAESIQQEYTDDDFSLQFMALSSISATLISHLLLIGGTDEHGDFVNDTLQEVVELVDTKIDALYDDFISPKYALKIRHHLLERANSLLGSIFIFHRNSESPSINLPIILAQFNTAFNKLVDAISLTAMLREF